MLVDNFVWQEQTPGDPSSRFVIRVREHSRCTKARERSQSEGNFIWFHARLREFPSVSHPRTNDVEHERCSASQRQLTRIDGPESHVSLDEEQIFQSRTVRLSRGRLEHVASIFGMEYGNASAVHP